ncbi:hypothetical protein GCM10009738_71390 [Kitasatospora viridis]
MTDVLRELCDVLHALSDAERVTLLGELGVGEGARKGEVGEGRGRPAEGVPTPLPGPREGDGVVSEIEWV